MNLKNKNLIISFILFFWVFSIFSSIWGTLYFKDNELRNSALKSISREDRKKLDRIEIEEQIHRISTFYFEDDIVIIREFTSEGQILITP